MAERIKAGLRVVNGEDGQSQTTGCASPFLLNAGVIQVSAGLQVWTADEWVREQSQPPAHEVIALVNGVRIRIAPHDERIHGSLSEV